MISDAIAVRAKLRLRTTEEGGRKGVIKSGYRPNHVFEYKESNKVSSYMGEVQFSEDEWIEPGEEKIVIVYFLNIKQVDQYLTKGRRWRIQEGNRLVGEGEIIELL